MTDRNERDYHLGLAMSGAISAGAYTAGVLDFLIQALEEWERHRGDADVPGHRTGIKVFAGASAGAITGALSVVGLARKQEPVRFGTPQEGKQVYKCFLPSLYQTWVELPDAMPNPDLDMPGFLSASDIEGQPGDGKKHGVVSLLNSAQLDKICGRALSPEGEPGGPRAYIAKDFHVYMTLANTRGVPYSIDFAGGKKYSMQMHCDRAHYVVTGLGEWDSESAFGKNDQSYKLDAGNLFSAARSEWTRYSLHAVASGAFPIGLSARGIEAKRRDYNDRLWPVEEACNEHREVQPDWPTSGPANNLDTPYNFVAVDGGMFNNDPLEYARFVLRRDVCQRNPRGASEADRAVIMITPFPEPPALSSSNEMPLDLPSVLLSLFPALKNQARFKLSELILAQDQNVRSRFMIVPKRTPKGSDSPEPYGLASGLLGGFGGFLAQKFRDHDFQLGRRNCQRFLREELKLAPRNPIVERHGAADGNRQDNPVIPLCGTAKAEVPYPEWPKIELADIERITEAASTRMKKLCKRLVSTQAGWWLQKMLIPARRLAMQCAPLFIKWSILSELIERDQITEWTVPPAWRQDPAQPVDPVQVRKVWAALAKPRYCYWSAESLRLATGVPMAAVKRILLLSEAASPDSKFKVEEAPFRAKSGSALYSFAIRLTLSRRIPLIGSAVEWLWPSVRDDVIQTVPEATREMDKVISLVETIKTGNLLLLKSSLEAMREAETAGKFRTAAEKVKGDASQASELSETITTHVADMLAANVIGDTSSSEIAALIDKTRHLANLIEIVEEDILTSSAKVHGDSLRAPDSAGQETMSRADRREIERDLRSAHDGLEKINVMIHELKEGVEAHRRANAVH